MTGSDEGGFTPHPGDPWHPDWTDDADLDENLESPEAAIEPEPELKPKKPKRRGRRKRQADGAATELDFDPTASAFDQADDPTDGAEAPPAEDLFEAVLEREGPATRLRPGTDGETPSPAWTIDEEPDPDQALPIEQPSWIGQATGTGTGVDEVGFESEQLVPPTDDETSADGSADAEQPPAETPVAAHPPDDGDSAEVADTGHTGIADADLAEKPGGGVVGKYGVAGPEAFDVLHADDASTGEIDDWDSYMAGSPAVPDAGESLVLPAAAAMPEQEAPEYAGEPKKRRGLFRRRKREVDQVIEDGFVGAAAEAEVAAPPDPGVAAEDLGAPGEPPAGVDAFDEWIESDSEQRRGLFGRGKRDDVSEFIGDDAIAETDQDLGGVATGRVPDQIDDVAHDGSAVVDDSIAPEDGLDTTTDPAPGSVEDAGFPPVGDPAVAERAAPDVPLLPEDIVSGDVAAAVTEALEALGTDGDDVASLEIPSPVDAAATDALDVSLAGPDDVGEQRDLFAETSRPEPSDESTAQLGSVAEPAGFDQFEPDLEAGSVQQEAFEWEGDAGRVPAGWMADIDEDEVVPPHVPGAPDTDLGDEPEGGPGEGQDQWQAEPIDVFDIEEPAVPSPQPRSSQEIVSIPEGYEPWQEAVAEAVEAGEAIRDQVTEPVDDETYEYEQPILEDPTPATDDLPPGFERFPGGSAIDQFDLPEETMRAHLETDASEQGWVTDDVNDAQIPTEAMDVPYAGGPDFDEDIYASGTIEHRDLAAAIAEAGDEDTEWQAISAAMPGMDTAVLGFEDVADLGSGGEYVAPARSNLGTRVVTGLALVTLLFGSLFLAAAAFAVFIGLVVMLGLTEFYGALRRAGYLPLSLFGIAGGVGTLFATWFHGPLAIPAGVLLTSMVTFFFYAFSPTRRDALSNGGLTILGVSWIVATAALAIPIGRAEDYVVLVFAIVLVTAATDIGAFSFGRAWGKRPLAAVLSPNKTTEGLAGGIILAFVAGGGLGFLELGPFDLASGLALGAIAALFAPIGDLAESMIKRSLGVKDMGSTLPGHGGVLDRIDAFLFVIPAAWVLYEAIGFLG